MVELKDIDGVGPSKEEILKSHGITSVEQLAIKDPEEVKLYLESSLAVAKKVIKSAKDLCKGSVKMCTGGELDDEQKAKIQYISTGSNSLDSLFLHGKGVPTDAIIAWYGAFGSAKTQLCNQIAVNLKAQYPGRKTVWVETEPSTLVLDRLKEIAEARKIPYDIRNDIMVIAAKFMDTPNHQFMAYENIEEEIKKGMDVGLIVIDSFNALFRSTYTGRETLPARSAESGRHIGMLQRLASKYNICILLTLQVMGVPDSGTALGCMKKFGINTPPVTSNVVKHGVNYMIGLEQISSVDKTWKAVIADGPVPRGDTVFVIDETGIANFFDKKGK